MNLFFKSTYEGKMPVSVLKIKTVTHHKRVLDWKTPVADRNVRPPVGSFVQKSADTYGSGFPGGQGADEKIKGQTRIYDVFYYYDMKALDIFLEILGYFHRPGRRRGDSIAGSSDEIQDDRNGNFPEEICYEKHGALQHADENNFFSGKIAAYFFGHFRDPLLKGCRIDKNLGHVIEHMLILHFRKIL
jgi:hypothetical protein